jgi:PII-like signaling protein
LVRRVPCKGSFVADETDAHGLPSVAGQERTNILETEKAVKVSIYLSEGATHRGVRASSSILDFLFFRGVSGAIVLKGIAGFGADRHLHSSASVEISGDLPVKVEFIETRDKVEQLIGKLGEIAGDAVIELHDTTVVKQTTRSKGIPISDGPAQVTIEGKAQLMQIYIGESDRWRDRPLHEALVYAMRANDLAGVTVYRGILGYGAHRRMHKDAPLHLSHDASIVLSVIDTEEKLRAFLPIAEQMVGEGIVVFSDADIIKYAHRGAASGSA